MEQKGNNWIQNTLFGALMACIGLMLSFFPKVIATVSFMLIGVVFLIIGITDAIASLRYKDNTGGWKSGLITGIAGILVSGFFLLTFYMPSVHSKVTTNIAIIVISAWCVLKCAVTLIGILIGKIKRKGVALPAFITGLIGIALFIFRKSWALIEKYGGYALLAAGVLMVFVGLYKRADRREKMEKEQRELEAAESIEKENEKGLKLLEKINRKKDKEEKNNNVNVVADDDDNISVVNAEEITENESQKTDNSEITEKDEKVSENE